MSIIILKHSLVAIRILQRDFLQRIDLQLGRLAIFVHILDDLQRHAMIPVHTNNTHTMSMPHIPEKRCRTDCLTFAGL